MGYNVAIDGPAGAGKSTIAKLVARKRVYLCGYRSDVQGTCTLFSGRRHCTRGDTADDQCV